MESGHQASGDTAARPAKLLDKFRLTSAAFVVLVCASSLLVVSGVSERIVLPVALMLALAFPPLILRALANRTPKSTSSTTEASIIRDLEASVGTHVSLKFGTWQGFVKRLLDISLSLVGIFLLLLYFPWVVFGILAEDGRPVLTFSGHVGRRGRPFRLLTFRTTRSPIPRNKEPSESPQRPTQTTRIGAVLQRGRLDLLPAFINVLSGDMSLIGPAPYQHPEPGIRAWLDILLQVRPGLVSVSAVISRMRKTQLSPFHRYLWDAYYVNNWSLIMDFRVGWWFFRSLFHQGGNPPTPDALGKALRRAARKAATASQPVS
jgi:lipopolysaccharide/colanic/teichoic acid biosynthesis glycosyltransferase